MALRVILFGFIGLAIAMVGVVGFTMLRPPPPPRVASEAPPPPPATIRVLVAARPLNAGTLLKPEDIAVRERPAGEAAPDLMLDSEAVRSELRGALVRRHLSPEEPFTHAYVLRPRDRGFLAAVLSPGLRAISVGVDAVSGAAGLIWPGDRIDLILTQTIDEEQVPLGRRVVGETVLADVRVLAVDQALTQGADSASVDTEGRTPRTVTLETTPVEAERVAVAARLGRLALTVRAIDDQAVGELPPPRAASTFGGDVSPALKSGTVEPRLAPSTIRLHHGAKTEEVTLR